MIPILWPFASALFFSGAAASACAYAITGATVVKSSSRMKKSARQEQLSLDSARMLRIEDAITKKLEGRPMTKQEKAAFLECPITRTQRVTKEMLPPHLHHLAGRYVLTRQDDIVLLYYLLHKQVKHQVGELGELIKELNAKDPKLARKLYVNLLGDGEVIAVIDTLVEEGLLGASKLRLKDKTTLDALRRAAEEEKQKRLG